MNEKQWFRLAWAALGCLILYHSIQGYLSGDDFRYHYWGAQRALAQGSDLFTRSWIYIPTASIVMMPLALLPYELADLLWFCVRVGALVGLLMLAYRWSLREAWLSEPRGRWILFAAAVCVSRPLLADFRHGQINVILFSMVSFGCWLSLCAGFSSILGGGLMALGGMMKGPPLLLLGFPLIQKRWRALFGAALVIVGLLLATRLWFGAENDAKNWADYAATSHRKVMDHPWQERLISIPEAVLFFGDRFGVAWTGELAQRAWLIECAILGLMFLGLRWWRGLRYGAHSAYWDWGALGLGVALLSPMTGQHHLFCIFPAMLALLANVFGDPGSWSRRRVRAGALVAAVALMMLGKADPHGAWIFGWPNFSVLLGLVLLSANFLTLPVPSVPAGDTAARRQRVPLQSVI